jgi:hypothetical protein
METVNGNIIELQEKEEGYAAVYLEMPSPINGVKFTFGSIEDAQAFAEILENAIDVSSPLTHP